MDNKKPIERKPKTNGVKGRSSSKDIEKRLKICRKFINENSPMSKSHYLKEYPLLLDKQGLTVPTEQTMIKDARRCNITFSNGSSQTQDYTMFNYLGHLLSPDIRQIRLGCLAHDSKLLDIATYDFKIRNLKSKAKKINNDLKKKISSEEDLVYINIILKENGLEKYIEHVFGNEFSAPKDFLYIEKNFYSTKIYFEYQNYDNIINKIFEIVEELEPYE